MTPIRSLHSHIKDHRCPDGHWKCTVFLALATSRLRPQSAMSVLARLDRRKPCLDSLGPLADIQRPRPCSSIHFSTLSAVETVLTITVSRLIHRKNSTFPEARKRPRIITRKKQMGTYRSLRYCLAQHARSSPSHLQ
jgi:hypothetical protein